MIFKNKYRITKRFGMFFAEVLQWYAPIWTEIPDQGGGYETELGAEVMANRHAVDFVVKDLGWLPK